MQIHKKKKNKIIYPETINMDEENRKLYEKINSRDKPKNAIKTFFRLLSYVKKEKVAFITGVILLIIGAICSVTWAYLCKPAMDAVTLMDSSLLSKTIIQLVIVMLCLVICNYLGTLIFARMSQRIVYGIRKELFAKLQNMEISFFDNNPSGETISIFTNDVELLSTAFDQCISKIPIILLKIAITLGFLIYLNPLLSLIVIFLLAIYISTVIILGKLGSKNSRLKQFKLASLSSYTQEIAGGLKTVKVLGQEDYTYSKFKNLAYSLQDSCIKTYFFSSVIRSFSTIFMTIVNACIALIGGILTIGEKITFGTIFAYFNLIKFLTEPIQEFSTQLANLLMAIASAERVFNTLDMPNEIDEGKVDILEENDEMFWINPKDNSKAKVEAKVDIKNVYFKYDKNVDEYVLKDVSMHATKGETIALVGSTGAGKTTITNLINRFYEIDKGVIEIDGIDICNIKKSALRRIITTVLQDTILFSGSILENIRYSKLDATDEEVLNAAKMANIDSFIHTLPNGYDTVIDSNDIMLSHGQIQLISIARAILAKSKIIILDEATSSIDTKTEELVQLAMKNLTESKTTFVIAHRLSTIRTAKAILLLENGKIIERGTHNQLMQLNGKYANLYRGNAILD